MEDWKPIPNMHGRYEASSLGRIRSVDRVQVYYRDGIRVERLLKGRILRPYVKPDGHLQIMLGRERNALVHQLVLEAFVGPFPAGHEARHLDDVPGNNALENLVWGTRSDNLIDAVRNGKKKIGSGQWNAKLTESDIPVIRELAKNNNSEEIAKMFGVSGGSIRQIIRGRSWKHVAQELSM